MSSETSFPPKLAYSIKESVKATSLSRALLYSHIKEGRLRAVRIGGRTVIPADSLKSFIGGEV